ncbi:MAG: mannitol dehydrogenase family protein [Devosia sp.]
MQFGTSRFLQAHFDLFVHEARLEGQAVGPITVVKTSASSERADRVRALGDAAGFPVRIRGNRDGGVVDETVTVNSVERALDAGRDWAAVVDCFAATIDLAVSNVGERGYEVADEHLQVDFARPTPPRSFPGKLVALLLARYRSGGRKLLFLPMELRPSNGQALRRAVLSLAEGAPGDFRLWLEREVVFADTLVDRIVSEAIEPIGAIAEPYALLAVSCRGATLPFTHPAIRLVERLEPFERLKIHILNLGHTALADIWFRQNRPKDETVREILADQAVAQSLGTLYLEEVLSGFTARGMADDAHHYIATTLERFRNPFLNHRLSDIAVNHAAKVRTRIAGFIEWVHAVEPSMPFPRLGAIAGR